MADAARPEGITAHASPLPCLVALVLRALARPLTESRWHEVVRAPPFPAVVVAGLTRGIGAEAGTGSARAG